MHFHLFLESINFLILKLLKLLTSIITFSVTLTLLIKLTMIKVYQVSFMADTKEIPIKEETLGNYSLLNWLIYSIKFL
jgi:hypothetical protein